MDVGDPGFAVTADGLTCQARSEYGWEGARGTVGVTKGCYYYEAVVSDEGAYCGMNE